MEVQGRNLDGNGNLSGTTYYSGQDVLGGAENSPYRFAVRIFRSTGRLPTGRYSWTMTITEYYGGVPQPPLPSISGVVDVLNWSNSPFGQGWWLSGYDSLVPQGSDLLLVQSDGTMGLFTPNGNGTYSSLDDPFQFMTITSVAGDFNLTGTNGTMESFNSSGQLIAATDADGNVTTYAQYTTGPSSGLLHTITNPAQQTTTLYYSNRLLSEIKDFANRYTYLDDSGNQLTTVVGPDPNNANLQGASDAVTNFGYDPVSGLLASMTDADANTTEYFYRPDGTLETVTADDGSTTTYQSARVALDRHHELGARGSATNPSLLTIADAAAP